MQNNYFCLQLGFFSHVVCSDYCQCTVPIIQVEEVVDMDAPLNIRD